MKVLQFRTCAGLTFLMLGWNQNIWAAEVESAILLTPDFTSAIVLVIGPDGASSASLLAAKGASINWQDSVYANIKCEESGYAARPGAGGLNYSISGYSVNGDTLFKWLTKYNYIKVADYAVILTNTPWGNIPRGYRCIINSDGTELQKKVGNVHAGGSVNIGTREFVKWTFKNNYQTPMAGKGNVKVFAGTFDYRIKPLLPGISFPSVGSASVKAYLDPDNGRWVMTSFEKHDPAITLDSSGVSLPPMLSLPSVPPPPKRPVFFKEGKNDNDRQQDESVCGMAAINGQLKGMTWIDCMVQKGWQVRSPTAEQRPVQASPEIVAKPPSTSSNLAEVVVDGCHRFVAESAIANTKNCKWKGSCKDGYEDGAGVQSCYSPGSVRPFSIVRGVKARGEFTSGSLESVAVRGNGQLIYCCTPGSGPTIITVNGLPDWAREFAN
ncbi:MAG: hypothetical protein KGK17_03185 [Betaproteobacteria bacterium]|nr:hypothetical protein [Betaproteobacteria bacterium]